MERPLRTIYINGRFLSATMSGVPRFGRGLLQELDALHGRLDDTVRIEIFIPRNVRETPAYKYLKVRRVGRLNGHAWEQLELPFYARKGILFSPTGSAPLMYSRNVVTIHDAIVFAAPAGFSQVYLLWYRLLSKVLCRTALHIVTVSQFSKRELGRWCGADLKKITVVYPGVHRISEVVPDNSVQTRHGLKRFGYVLAVGSLNPNKNFESLVLAQDFLTGTGLDMVFVGQTIPIGRKHFSRERPIDLSRVKNVGFVTDQELRSLYENAGCFVFPSLYEGFGLPPLEALSLGCPTVVSNVASLPEVCGEVAVLCDPQSAEDIAKKIRYAVGLREGPANAKRFADFAAKYTYAEAALILWRMLINAAADHCLQEPGESSQ